MKLKAETYFIRHTAELDLDDQTRQRLWNGSKIAIHFPRYADKRKLENYPDNPSLDPKDYPSTDATPIRRFGELAAAGGYVCAQYYPRQECVVGYVPAHSKVELLKGSWGTLNGFQGRRAVLKCLTLTRPRIIRDVSLATILVGRPIRGTISRWPNARDAILNIVEGKMPKLCVELLFPYQQEIMCSEFLRTPDVRKFGLPRMAHLVLPIGRTMKDLDICGITENGDRVLAQVTYRNLKDAGAKLSALRQHRSNPTESLILFCKADARKKIDGIHVVPLEAVYDCFTASNRGRTWLKSAVGAISISA